MCFYYLSEKMGGVFVSCFTLCCDLPSRLLPCLVGEGTMSKRKPDSQITKDSFEDDGGEEGAVSRHYTLLIPLFSWPFFSFCFVRFDHRLSFGFGPYFPLSDGYLPIFSLQKREPSGRPLPKSSRSECTFFYFFALNINRNSFSRRAHLSNFA